jgi:signal transduction histidine kinase
MTASNTQPRGVDETLLRIVLGWRVFSVLWMGGLVIETVATDDRANNTIVITALVVAATWTAVTLWVARFPRRFRSVSWMISDGVIVAAIALAPLAADSESSFYGGFVLSWVIYIAYVAGERWFLAGAISATVMGITQVLDEVIRQDQWSVVGDVAVFFVTAWVMGAGMWSLRRNEALRIAAERQLADERGRRQRADERSELAARLHDSVLQTLPVMRQRADDTAAVRNLSRRVERQMRQFLGRLDSEYADGLRAAMRDAAWDVEDLYDVEIEAVSVGDYGMNDALRAVVAASREALLNAAKHSGVERIDLYSEVRDGTVRVFVRDRGAGFDPDRVRAGGRGIAESIVGRIDRYGGTSAVRSTPGSGTEVEITLPLDGG